MVMELKDLQELKDSDPATWDYDRLTAMLHERNRVYKQMEADSSIPPFLQSWLLYLTSMQMWELPDYNLLHGLLSKSYLHWVDHNARKPRGKRAQKLHAAEE